jgi:hypothetical protein
MRIEFRFAVLVAALAGQVVPASSEEPEVLFLDQGWNDGIRTQFYHTPQGSHMMPADLFAALEQPNGGGRFGDPAFLSQFGFLAPDGPSTLNPSGYPIGLAVEANANQVGLTCAACHTAEVEVNGERIRVDGAPGSLDFDSFYQALALAVRQTSDSDALFERFADNFGASEADREALRAQLRTVSLRMTSDAVLRRPALASGFGRVDALTQIINSLAVSDQAVPTNMHPVAAPTSYPPLWLAPQLEFVQWAPIAASPIARNGGQVLGVFGRSDMQADAGDDAFSSSILLTELRDLETWLQALEPPEWDEARMGPIDLDLAASGAELFADHCAACHNMKPYRRTDPAENFFGETFIEIGRIDISEVGTDPAYIQSLVTRWVETNSTTAPLFGGEAVVPGAAFFGATVQANVRRAIAEAQLTPDEIFALNGFRFTTGENGEPVPYTPQLPLTYLKASPLAGVWATGPYLHNGSVPTVYELLSPVEDRRDVFWTGGRALDLQLIGYISDDAPGRFLFDTSLPGNGNEGHLYPSEGLTHDERMAIIEYLKGQ